MLISRFHITQTNFIGVTSLHVLLYLLVYVLQNNFDGKEFLGFKAVTLVPFEPKLINYEMLDSRHVSRSIKVWHIDECL